MDVLLYSRYRRGGGRNTFRAWELSQDLEGWEDAPAPAQVGRRLAEGLFQRSLPDGRARLVNNVTHWVYGIMGGAQYGILAGSLRSPKARHGLVFGTGVWLTGYAVLPAMGLYRPIWEYDGATLAKDLSAHLIYGLATASAYGLLTQKGTS